MLDACGGAGSQWSSKSSGTNTAYQNEIAKATKCWLLNVMGDSPDVEACEVGVWSFGASCPATAVLNSEFIFNKETNQIKIVASDRVAKTCPDPANCCLQATPCVSPCSLPLGSGWVFVLAVAVCSTLYIGGGMGYSVKVQGKDASEGIIPLLPHREFWRSVRGLCADGWVFTQAEVAKRRGGGGGYEKVPDASAGVKEAAKEAVEKEEVDSEEDGDELVE